MITVIDSPCGTGKTETAIKIMKKNKLTRFIYITPFLSEVERIKNAVKDTISPTTNTPGGTKYSFVLDKLTTTGNNIATTHSLFERFDDAMADVIETQHMTLILDEVVDVVKEVDPELLHPDDVEIMLNNNLISIEEETGQISWLAKDYNGRKFSDTRTLIENSKVFAMKFNQDRYSCFIWTFPPKVFTAFDNVYVLTYMFKQQIQRYYYDIYNIPYVIKTLSDKKEIIDINDYEKDLPVRYLDKIHIYEGKSNIVGQVDDVSEYEQGKERIFFDRPKYHSLSRSWYKRKGKIAKIQQVEIEKKKAQDVPLTDKDKQPNTFDVFKRYISNVIKNNFKTKKDDIIWTTFKEYKDLLSGNGYSKGFLPCNARSTNEYMNCHYVMYLINRYMNPYVKKFIESFDVKINSAEEDMYALSEMIQFIYRSAIRKGEDIWVYIPSERMRKLLQYHIQEHHELVLVKEEF